MRGAGGDVDVLLVCEDRLEARVLITRDVHRLGEPRARHAVVLEEGQVARVALERRVQERRDVDLGDASLIGRRDEVF